MKNTLNVPEVKKIAAELGITPAQVVISWHIQRGTVVLPKSVTPSRVVENLQGACASHVYLRLLMIVTSVYL